MKNGYTKIFFPDPKSAVFTWSNYKIGIFSKGHWWIKIVPIFLHWLILLEPSCEVAEELINVFRVTLY